MKDEVRECRKIGKSRILGREFFRREARGGIWENVKRTGDKSEKIEEKEKRENERSIKVKVRRHN